MTLINEDKDNITREEMEFIKSEGFGRVAQMKIEELLDNIRISKTIVNRFMLLDTKEGTEARGIVNYMVSLEADSQEMMRIEIEKLEKRLKLHKSIMKSKIDPNSASKNVDIEVIKMIPIEAIMPEKPKNTRGKTQKYLCPIHNEKNPSFFVDTEKNLFHCFGCQVGGDIINLYMLLYKVDFKRAIQELNNLK